MKEIGRLCLRSILDIFAKLKQEYFCCRANELKPRRVGTHWCGGFWLVALGTLIWSLVIFGRDCGN